MIQTEKIELNFGQEPFLRQQTEQKLCYLVFIDSETIDENNKTDIINRVAFSIYG